MLQLTSPRDWYKKAQGVFETSADIQFVIFGHTHNPEQRTHLGNKKYYNTGTWIPVFETDAGEIRADKIYSFLHLPNKPENTTLPYLMRWNDDALRIEPLTLIDRK
jgi:hypothetical protein